MLETTNSSDYYGNPAVAEINEYLGNLPQNLTAAFKAVKKAVGREAPDALAYSVADKAVRLVALRCGDYEIRLRTVEFDSEVFTATDKDVVVNEGTAFQAVATRGVMTTRKYRLIGEGQYVPFDLDHLKIRIEPVGEPTLAHGVMKNGYFTAHPVGEPAVLTGSLPSVGERKVV